MLAHYNHGLRGAESDGDQAFVKQLARKMSLEVLSGKREGISSSSSSSSSSSTSSSTLSSSSTWTALTSRPHPLTPAPPLGLMSEESSRALRYEFLARAAGRVGARYVATAHTADDQVETVLANFVRGTGLAGLAGIPRVRQLTDAATLIRPLLDVTRAEVLDYLRQIEQPFRDDSSNAKTDYTRNRIRHELLPLLARDYNPQVREAILRLSRLAGEADDEITGLAADLAAQCRAAHRGGHRNSRRAPRRRCPISSPARSCERLGVRRAGPSRRWAWPSGTASCHWPASHLPRRASSPARFVRSKWAAC